ncbi:MAG: DNA alkylation repair protein [Chloroflexota bacterium]
MTTTAETVLAQLSADNIKMSTLKKLAKEIKKDHELAMTLWASEQFYPRMLAVLILDKNRLTQDTINQMMDDLQSHETEEQLKIVDWLLANQLTKSKKVARLVESWEKADSPLLRRLFWYHQARLRWMGKIPHDNGDALLTSLETDLATAEPEVQWAMNFTAGQIGIHDVQYRSRCIELGERVGLYKGDPVARGCTPEYLPEFIRIEVAKRAY